MNPGPDQRTDVVVQTTLTTAPHEFSLIGFATVILRYRWSVIWVAAIVFALVVIGTFLQRRTYTAPGSFMPVSSDAGSLRLSGIAAQFGFAVPTGEAGESPEFYAELLRSPEILRPVVETEFEFIGKAARWFSDTSLITGNLIELYEVDRGTYDKSREFTVLKLGRNIAVRTERDIGVVRFSVTTFWPEVSAQIAAMLLELVNDFNLETRQSQATVERQFVEERLAEVEQELLTAENALQVFLQTNRDYQDSPQLVFERERLQRDVLHRQQVATSLAESYEQARIEEVRNTPVLTIVEKPRVPVFPNRRRLALKGVLALMFGCVLGVFVALGRDFLARSRETEPREYAEMVALGEEVFAGLRKFRPRRRSRRVERG